MGKGCPCGRFLYFTGFGRRETAAGLLLVEPASAEVQLRILEIAECDPAVNGANGVVTVHPGPDQIVASISAEFEDAATATEIEASVDRIEAALKVAVPEVTTLFVKPQTAGRFAERAAKVARGDAP